jgi:hypothetical protein
MVVYGSPAGARGIKLRTLIARGAAAGGHVVPSLSMYGCPAMRLPFAAAPSRRASDVPGFGGVGLHRR